MNTFLEVTFALLVVAIITAFVVLHLPSKK